MSAKYYDGSFAIKSVFEIESAAKKADSEQTTGDKIPVYFIEDFDQLAKLASTWKGKECLAIDTEFERRTTFYAKLALVQIFDGEAIYLVDPLKTDCPDTLKTLLEDNNTVKILHSSKEDLEVLYTSWNCKLSGLFDTQVAYSFLTDELSIGYAKLVELRSGEFVSKQQTNSDWTKRPLSQEQLSYAAKDVLYLIDIYRQLDSELTNKSYRQFFNAECEEYCRTSIDRIDIAANYRDAADVWQLSETDLGLFKQLFDWREQTARSDNRTKNHIIRDQGLVHLAQLKAENSSQLKAIKDLHPRSLRLYATTWFTVIAQWQASDKIAEKPVINPREIKQLKELANTIESTVKTVAQENKISTTLLFSKRLIRKLAYSILSKEPMPAQWQGWRKSLMEASLQEKLKQFVS